MSQIPRVPDSLSCFRDALSSSDSDEDDLPEPEIGPVPQSLAHFAVPQFMAAPRCQRPQPLHANKLNDDENDGNVLLAKQLTAVFSASLHLRDQRLALKADEEKMTPPIQSSVHYGKRRNREGMDRVRRLSQDLKVLRRADTPFAPEMDLKPDEDLPLPQDQVVLEGNGDFVQEGD